MTTNNNHIGADGFLHCNWCGEVVHNCSCGQDVEESGICNIAPAGDDVDMEAEFIAAEDRWAEDNDVDYPEEDDNMTDAEADADTLRGIGWGTDEDYGYYGDDCDFDMHSEGF